MPTSAHPLVQLARTFLLASLAAFSPSALAEDEAPAAGEIPIRSALVIGNVGSYGRAPVHTDAIEYALVTGTWQPPTAGDLLRIAPDQQRTWVQVDANDKGQIAHAALRPGYAFASVELDSPQVMLLAASGHSLVYVNREPRVGDPYRHGNVRIPVSLHQGPNELLFVCARGGFQARLLPLEQPQLIDTHDPTVPDIIVGETDPTWAALVVINASAEPLRATSIRAHVSQTSETTPVAPPILPFSMRKVPFRLPAMPAAEPGARDIRVILSHDSRPRDQAVINVRVRTPHQLHKRTYRSRVDGSVQYYAVQPPPADAGSDQPPALFLTLHGAGVEALGQARAYQPKNWTYIVAPTNRRSFGFDWEDWGRIDAIEVLADAQQRYRTDPQRTYLTGHSMGGHGVWHVGATLPCRWAAIAPSAGWISFWTYAGAAELEQPDDIAGLLRRATNPSRTLLLSDNFNHFGIYVLHGEQDDNVPVEQARTMRTHLAEFHRDFAYFEKPGAGHWWGNQCVDWPPLIEFCQQRTRPAPADVHKLEFVTLDPTIASECHWLSVQSQQDSRLPSRVDLRVDPEQRRLYGTTENVTCLRIALHADNARGARVPLIPPGAPLALELDGQQLRDLTWAGDDEFIWLSRRNDAPWHAVIGQPRPAYLLPRKRPGRAGPFRHVFDNNVVLVYGTAGSPAENQWAFAKARYDAEAFWYRGNGALPIIPDFAFDAEHYANRNIVLYGNATTNVAWSDLVTASPARIRPGNVHLAGRNLVGDNLALLAVYPRPAGDDGLVGIVGGSGLPGMRITERLPYFVSGVHYPDWLVLHPDVLRHGVDEIRGAGFFDQFWRFDPDQSAFRED